MKSEKIVIPSNEEVLYVTYKHGDMTITDEGNKKSAKTIKNSKHIKEY